MLDVDIFGEEELSFVEEVELCRCSVKFDLATLFCSNIGSYMCIV